MEPAGTDDKLAPPGNASASGVEKDAVRPGSLNAGPDVSLPVDAGSADELPGDMDGHEVLAHSDHLIHPSRMTVGRFIEEKFAPEHIYCKRYAGRSFYQAILKHVIQPEEVDRIFQKNPADPRKTLRSLRGWPYLNRTRLCDVQEHDINQITEAASKHGYSVETIRHIRSVIGAIFSHAIRENCFTGENPVSRVKPLRRSQRQKRLFSPAEAKSALQLMRYPEKPFILIGAMTGMLPSEIIGLQWRQINMTENEAQGSIPPLTIAVRKRWYRGELDSVRKNSLRDVTISRTLLSVLHELKCRSRFTGPEDFVLISQFGTPISHDNLMTQRLRPIAKRLDIPAISSRAFLHVQDILASESISNDAQDIWTSPFESQRYAS